MQRQENISENPSVRVLHVANWYPNPWNPIEGNFVRDQIRLFSKEAEAKIIAVQVRSEPGTLFRYRQIDLDLGGRGYFISTRLQTGKATEWLSTILLMMALVRERAWRFDLLHFHIAYPLLLHVQLWRWLVRVPVVISEHWSAYHFNFYLPQGAKSVKVLRQPFQHGFSVLAVSQALFEDILKFSGRNDLNGCVIPNVVPLHGARPSNRAVPVLFVVNRWARIKDPIPMLEGLALAAADGFEFELVVGGYGEMILQMEQFVADSALAGRTRFCGLMSKTEIAMQLAVSDGYLFSSQYETFSVACAEALGAGVPLIGPYLPAIAEYAGQDDWERVETRDAAGWGQAIRCFLERRLKGGFDPAAIAARASSRFSPEVLQAAYREVLAKFAATPTQSVQG